MRPQVRCRPGREHQVRPTAAAGSRRAGPGDGRDLRLGERPGEMGLVAEQARRLHVHQVETEVGLVDDRATQRRGPGPRRPPPWRGRRRPARCRRPGSSCSSHSRGGVGRHAGGLDVVHGLPGTSAKPRSVTSGRAAAARRCPLARPPRPRSSANRWRRRAPGRLPRPSAPRRRRWWPARRAGGGPAGRATRRRTAASRPASAHRPASPPATSLSSTCTSTFAMPRCWAQATPATGTVPAATVWPLRGVSMRDDTFTGACWAQPRRTQ